jgi:fluoride ion exporter CrcB/FEX
MNTDSPVIIRAPSEDEQSIPTPPLHHIHKWNWLLIFYLSTFSICGITIRAFMGRFFGGDCDSAAAIDDWLTPLSRRICVTSTGMTDQTGGALFIDLPANMFGSFIMGMVTGHSKKWPPLPWLNHDHPLQNEGGLHVGFRTALCGTITTYSSWNTQMVAMIDGTDTYLGSQVVAALFGYILGLQAAITSFRAGRTAAAWLHLKNSPHIFETDALTEYDSSVGAKQTPNGCHLLSARGHLFIVALGLFILYVLGDFYWGIEWYRQLWLSCCFGPFGTVLRWKLSTFNRKITHNNWQWLPLGTLAANFLGSVISATIKAITARSIGVDSSWVFSSLLALSLGFAGCLSTVSSFAKEIVEISDMNPHHDKKAFIYSHGTLIICCFIGMIFYSPIIRYA